MRRRTLLLALTALLASAPSSARAQVGVASPAVPTQASTAWPRSTFEQQGMRAEPLAQVVERARSGAFGNIDRLVVIRNGNLLLSERFGLDYRAISRGRRAYIGCGIDAIRL